MIGYEEVLQFWFEETTPEQKFRKDEEFDRRIAERFSTLHLMANRCELYSWRETPDGRLAEIIILDQFSRNMFRGQPASFSSDPLALALAQEAVRARADRVVPLERRQFFYLPFMHSESPSIHQTAEKLYSQQGMENGLKWELKHKAIIDRFGRYPHRNAILGRESTQEELDFLMQPGSSF